MNDTTTAESLRAQGLEVETVGEILDGQAQEPAPTPFSMPVLDGYPVEWPGDGIFFGMPDEVYHTIPAGSASGVKRIAGSPMLFWATAPWLNPDYAEQKQEEEEKRKRLGQDHFDIGKAYHARLLEGREAFEKRFAVALDQKDFPNALVTIDDIKAAFPEGVKPRGKSKRELFDHLQSLDATVELWEDIKARHAAENEGMCFIPFKVKRELEKAAAIIERDPELGPLLADGYPEVSLFWHCPRTGVPMKCRADKLQIGRIVDLKTLNNSHEASIENAIRRDLANRRYVIQPAVYLEGVRIVRELVRQAPQCVHGTAEQNAWAREWATYQGETEWLWLYIQKGIAPVARGLTFPTRGQLMMFANDIVTAMKKRLRQYAEVYDLSPWIDRAPVYDLADEDLPNYALEI